jgi:STE24 endopeptidase
VVVEPLFNRFTPLSDGTLRTSVLALAEREGVTVDEVLVADASRRTTTLNAYVSGLGGTRRVVLYDNLLNDVPPAQVESVVAHELAHARHQDVVLGTGLGAVGAFLGMCALALVTDSRRLRRRAGVTGAADPAAAALLAALVAWSGLVSTPAQNSVSRAIEARADRSAVAATGDPDAFRAVQRELALTSLADPTPPAWSQVMFGSHPTVLQRMGLPASVERAAG